jgi:hypothetical protein
METSLTAEQQHGLRRAALSFAAMQMMNTIEYRVDCQLLQYLHHENNLGCR